MCVCVHDSVFWVHSILYVTSFPKRVRSLLIQGTIRKSGLIVPCGELFLLSFPRLIVSLEADSLSTGLLSSSIQLTKWLS